MDVSDIIQKFTDLGLKIIPLLAVVALLVFALGVGGFIRSADSEANIKKNKNILIWGAIGLFALFSVWGIVSFIRKEFGWNGNPVIPQLKTTYP